jgi:hypothetical protein
VAALTGVGVGGAIGGITGALIGMGIPEYEAKRYEGPVKEVASCCPSTPTIPIGPAKLKTFSSALAQMIFRRLAKPVPTSRRQTNQCTAQANIVTHMDLYPRLEGGAFLRNFNSCHLDHFWFRRGSSVRQYERAHNL